MNKEEIVAELNIEPDMSTWSEAEREWYFLEYPWTPGAKVFFETRKDILRKNIDELLRAISVYQILPPSVNYEQKFLEAILEKLEAIARLDIVNAEEIDNWADQINEEAFNGAVAFFNEHPGDEAAYRFFDFYPECQGPAQECTESRMKLCKGQ